MAQEGEPARAGWERRSGLISVCSGSHREREGGLLVSARQKAYQQSISDNAQKFLFLDSVIFPFLF
jgi:hypothetical protein